MRAEEPRKGVARTAHRSLSPGAARAARRRKMACRVPEHTAYCRNCLIWSFDAMPTCFAVASPLRKTSSVGMARTA